MEKKIIASSLTKYREPKILVNYWRMDRIQTQRDGALQTDRRGAKVLIFREMGKSGFAKEDWVQNWTKPSNFTLSLRNGVIRIIEELDC